MLCLAVALLFGSDDVANRRDACELNGRVLDAGISYSNAAADWLNAPNMDKVVIGQIQRVFAEGVWIPVRLTVISDRIHRQRRRASRRRKAQSLMMQ